MEYYNMITKEDIEQAIEIKWVYKDQLIRVVRSSKGLEFYNPNNAVSFSVDSLLSLSRNTDIEGFTISKSIGAGPKVHALTWKLDGEESVHSINLDPSQGKQYEEAMNLLGIEYRWVAGHLKIAGED